MTDIEREIIAAAVAVVRRRQELPFGVEPAAELDALEAAVQRVESAR